MALCPFAEIRTGGINNGGPRSHPIIGVTVHHMDGYWQGAESRFRDPSSNASAAFGFRFDGSIIQWLDTNLVDYHACQAQWEGWIGFENESDPSTPDAPPTLAQIASMGRVIAWLGVPATPATSRSGGGIGYHRQFPGPCNQAWGQTACPGQGFIDAIPAICAAAGAPTKDIHGMTSVITSKSGKHYGGWGYSYVEIDPNMAYIAAISGVPHFQNVDDLFVVSLCLSGAKAEKAAGVWAAKV